VIGSILGVLTMPFFVRALLRSVTEVQIGAVAMIVQLFVQVLTPIAIGTMLAALIPAVKEYVKEHKTTFSQVANTSIVLLVYEAISRDQVRHIPHALGAVIDPACTCVCT
jgi:predicted Na+-dependent transporter